MYGDSICNIKKAANGYIVEVRDPAIIKANKAREKLKYDSAEYRAQPYRDPCREFVMNDKEAVIKFLTSQIDKLVPDGDDQDYSSSFDAAVAEANAEPDEDD